MKNKFKHLLILITIILMCVSFAGCGSEQATETQDTPSLSAVAEITIGSSITKQNIQSTAANEKEITNNQVSSTKSSTQQASAKNKPTESTTKKAAETTINKVTTPTKNTNTTSTAATEKTASTTTATTSEITCTVEIECKKILNNMDKLKAGHEDFVPSNGIIMSTCTVTVDNGETVYDALKTACSKNGVSINAKSSAYGTYISGFNNIDEMDCGKQSGWVYTVNGSSPPKSCNKCTVSTGDKIVFSYTC